MSELTKVFNGKELKVIEKDGEAWFFGKDVADILGYSNTQKAIRDHVDEEDKTQNESFTVNGTAMVTINESGLYSLVLKSKMPDAKKFKRWITSEVLPSIRKHGAYMTNETIEQALLNPDTLIKLATNLKEEKTKRMIAEQRVNELQPKADYYDTFINNKGLVTITSIAKNYGMSATKMNKLLHEFGVQFKQSGAWFLYSKYQSEGYTHTEPHPYVDSKGRDQVRPNTKWTPKGHAFIYYLLKDNDILPKIEQ